LHPPSRAPSSFPTRRSSDLEDLIKPTFITATIGYGAIVIGLGMLGFLALLAGVQPMDGDLNNLIPQMAATYLPPFAVGLLRPITDRKSTRLNSSHVKISYAL